MVSLALAALEQDGEHARRAVESIVGEEDRKGHTHVADRLRQLLAAAPLVRTDHNSVASSPTTTSIAGALSPHARAGSRRLSDMSLSTLVLTAIRDLLSEQTYARELREVGLEPRHRLLLIGPPGTGKTSLAEAISVELGVPLYVLQYESIIGSFLGETSSRMGELFRIARERPCVLFLDEFETLAKERSDQHDAGEAKRIVSTLLLQLDGLPSHVVLVAATNHGELLDRAAWRRFQMVLELGLPDEQTREEFTRTLAHKVHAERPEGLASAARSMGNASFAELEEYVLSARRGEVIAGLRSKMIRG